MVYTLFSGGVEEGVNKVCLFTVFTATQNIHGYLIDIHANFYAIGLPNKV